MANMLDCLSGDRGSIPRRTAIYAPKTFRDDASPCKRENAVRFRVGAPNFACVCFAMTLLSRTTKEIIMKITVKRSDVPKTRRTGNLARGTIRMKSDRDYDRRKGKRELRNMRHD